MWGRSLGPARTPEDAALQLGYIGATRVHVFVRDLDVETDLAPWRAAMTLPEGTAEAGELVADVIVAAGEPAWLGVHRADDAHLPFAGGVIPVVIPDDAPSRAFGKIEVVVEAAKA